MEREHQVRHLAQEHRQREHPLCRAVRLEHRLLPGVVHLPHRLQRQEHPVLRLHAPGRARQLPPRQQQERSPEHSVEREHRVRHPVRDSPTLEHRPKQGLRLRHGRPLVLEHHHARERGPALVHPPRPLPARAHQVRLRRQARQVPGLQRERGPALEHCQPRPPARAHPVRPLPAHKHLPRHLPRLEVARERGPQHQPGQSHRRGRAHKLDPPEIPEPIR